jgi:hypothetical protein
MSCATQSFPTLLPTSPHDRVTTTRLQKSRISVGLPMHSQHSQHSQYSQRDSLIDSLTFLSRSLTRMRIQHAVMGPVSSTRDPGPTNPSSDRGQDIELLMSPEHYAKFRSNWLNQRLASIESDDHQFWDNRTGYLLRIYITGDWIKIGKRALRVPDCATLPKNEDGIAYWIPDASDTRVKPPEERRPWEKISAQSTIAA